MLPWKTMNPSRPGYVIPLLMNRKDKRLCQVYIIANPPHLWSCPGFNSSPFHFQGNCRRRPSYSIHQQTPILLCTHLQAFHQPTTIMDQIKNALSGNSSKEEKPANAQSSGQNQDYGDKGKATQLPQLSPRREVRRGSDH